MAVAPAPPPGGPTPGRASAPTAGPGTADQPAPPDPERPDARITTNPETLAGIVQAYAASIITSYQTELAAMQPLMGPTARAPHIEMEARGWFNPSLNYKYYMVPGILVALVTLIGTLLTAQNIAREKELGTLEQLNVTPIT